MTQKKVVLATISLHQVAGGLERNIIYLANYLADHGYNVHLVTFDLPDSESFYDFDESICWHRVGVNKPHSSVTFAQRRDVISKIRRIFKDDAENAPVICFHHGILFRFLLASFGLGNKLICSERNSLSLYKFIRASKWNFNFILMYFAARITVQFGAYRDDYPMGMRSRIRAIHNPVFPVEGRAIPGKANDEGRFKALAVTRLCAQKNLDQLIDAFADLAREYPLWDLDIVGDGDWGEALTRRIIKHGLEGRVVLHGRQKNVQQFYLKSHLFCMPSQWEGFPNSLAEALSYGLPAVGYENCSGVNILIEDGQSGMLAADHGSVGTLCWAMGTLMGQDDLRSSMGIYAAQSIEKYSPDGSFALWETLIEEVADR